MHFVTGDLHIAYLLDEFKNIGNFEIKEFCKEDDKKTIDELLDEGKSFKEINKIYKNK